MARGSVTKADQPRWSREIAGTGGIAMYADLLRGSLYVSDGWGVAFRAIRLQRCDLQTGQVLASVRLGDAAEAVVAPTDRDIVFAATSRRVIELRRTSLRVVRKRPSPIRYAKRAVFWRGLLVLANWLAPTVVVIDPDSDHAMRVVVGRVPFIEATTAGLLLASGEDGRIMLLSDPDAKKRLVRFTEPFRSLQHDDASGRIWIAVGRPVRDTRDSVDIGDPSTRLEAYDRDGGKREHVLDEPIWDFALGSREIWARSAIDGRRSRRVLRLAPPHLDIVGGIELPADTYAHLVLPQASGVIAIRERLESRTSVIERFDMA